MALQKLPGSIRWGKVHCSHEDDYIHVEIEDKTSGIRFLSINMSMKDFANALTGSHVDCDMEVLAVENIGKVREYQKRRVFMSDAEYKAATDDRKYEDKSGIVEWLKKWHTINGWNMDTYLGSRDSIQFADGGRWINFAYIRYVEQ